MRRCNGEGCVLQRPSGRWQGSLRLDGKRKTVYGKTRVEVVRKLEALRKQATTAGQLPDPGRRTVGDLLTAWLEAKGPSWRPRTLKDHTETCNRYIRPALGNVKLSRLTPERIQKLYSELQREGKHRTALKCHQVLRPSLAMAVRWGWLAHNPATLVEPPRWQAERRKLWSLEEVQHFLRETRDTEFGPFWVLAITTGCRLGELLALEWSDVDFEANTLSITKSRQRVNGQWLTLPPKTRAGMRVIALPLVALEALARQWERRGHSERVFPYTPERLARTLKAECARLNLPKMTVHALRHLNASLLLDSGLPVPAVAARLGHATPQVTMAVYAHHIRGQDQTAAVLDRKLGGGP